MTKLVPEDERDGLEQVRLHILFGKKDYPGAYAMARKMSDAHKEDADFQNQLAWRIATDPEIEKRDLDLAATFAERANTASGGRNPEVLDTVARVLFMQGKKDDAIQTQEKAVKLAEGDGKANLQKTLDSYKEGKLPKPK